MIVKWRDYVPEVTAVCSPQFSILLESYGIMGMDAADLFFRICQRYVGYAKLIYINKKTYFESLWGMHGLAEMFANKEAKWFIPLLNKRLSEADRNPCSDAEIKELLAWCAKRYNFWLMDGE
jgi:hypothetical protein